MDISEEDSALIASWAKRHPLIEQVWLYGSRARGTSRADSDIDLAVVMDFNAWFDWYAQHKTKPDLHLPHEVDLEWYDPAATDSERVGPGVKQDGILLYERDAVMTG